MKKIKFYLLLWLIIVAISSVGVLLGMFFSIVKDRYPEYLSAGLFEGTIIFVIALFITVYLHEAAHAIAFKVQGIGIRVIYVFPLCIIKEKESIKIHAAINMQIGFGGIVIPKMPVICNRLEYECLQKKVGVSLVSGPLCSTLLGIISFIALLYTEEYIDNVFCSYYFLFFCAMVLWSIYINITSLMNFGDLLGDYWAAGKIKSNPIYSLVQFYNFFVLQESGIKNEIRNCQGYFIEEIYEKAEETSLDIEGDSINVLLIDAALYEALLTQKKGKMDKIKIDMENLKNNIENISEKLRFEAYFKFFSHAVIYIRIVGKTEEAINLWEKYKNKMPNTAIGNYCFEQVELFLYKNNAEKIKLKENIKISSWDSLLSGISNYFDDEIYLNEMQA